MQSVPLTPPPPATPTHAAAAPPAKSKKKRSPLIILLFVIGTPLGALALLAGAGALFSFTGKDGPLEANDRDALVTAADLFATASIEARVDSKKETTGRKRYFDGSVEVDYEYESEEPVLYVSTSISLERNAKDAIATYLGQSVASGAMLGLSGENIKVEERPDLLSWGDQSKCALIKVGDEPVGNYFVARKGSRVYFTIFSGLYFDQPAAMKSFLEPKLAAMEKLMAK